MRLSEYQLIKKTAWTIVNKGVSNHMYITARCGLNKIGCCISRFLVGFWTQLYLRCLPSYNFTHQHNIFYRTGSIPDLPLANYISCLAEAFSAFGHKGHLPPIEIRSSFLPLMRKVLKWGRIFLHI